MGAEQISFYTNLLSIVVVFISWVIFGWMILFGRKAHSSDDKKREPWSWLGLAMQLSGIAVTAIPRQPIASGFVSDQSAVNIAVQIAFIILAISSVWLAGAALGELGKQWSLEARVLEGHKLIKTGVYGVVRHPIYTAMLGMLLATGFAVGHWLIVVIGLIVFLIGTRIRTHLEERLLHDAFGDEYDNWREKVPSLIPFLF